MKRIYYVPLVVLATLAFAAFYMFTIRPVAVVKARAVAGVDSTSQVKAQLAAEERHGVAGGKGYIILILHEQTEGSNPRHLRVAGHIGKTNGNGVIAVPATGTAIAGIDIPAERCAECAAGIG